MNEEDGPQNDELDIYVNIRVKIEQAWVIVDLARLRGFHELASEVISAIDEAANQLPSD